MLNPLFPHWSLVPIQMTVDKAMYLNTVTCHVSVWVKRSLWAAATQASLQRPLPASGIRTLA